MMSLISKFWNNFKTQPDIWFFFGFLLTFTLIIRKVLFFLPIKETFNEYSGIYIYLSDIFLILTFILWFITILYNNSLSLSMFKLWITRVLHNLYITLPLFLVFLSFLSIIWSENKSIAIFRSFKLLEFYLLYIYIIFRIVPQLFHACPPKNFSAPICDNNVPRGTSIDKKQELISDCSTWNNFGRVEQLAGEKIWIFFNIIIISSLIQAIIGIIQFFLQKSIGLFWLRESLISLDILGVAKIILSGEKYIRAYGLMPHPNVLGGFLLFSIIITLLYKKLFHACPPEKCSMWNIFGRVEQLWFFNLILTIQILALILTFSKSAIIGLLIALAYIIVPRGTFNTSFSFISLPVGQAGRRVGDEIKLFHVEHSRPIILSALIILLFTFIIIRPNLDSLLFNSLNERLFYLNVPRGTFESDPVFGLGAGQSVLSMQKYFPQKLEFWQYQPVHNVFLLIFSELGLIGLGLFIWWLWKLFHPVGSDNVPRGTLSEHGAGAEQNQKEPATLSFISLPARFAKATARQAGEAGRGAGGEVDREQENNQHILHNDNTYLSSIIISRYFKGILLGLIFIMLFDHYIWDVQQGSLLFWLTAGFVAGINRE